MLYRFRLFSLSCFFLAWAFTAHAETKRVVINVVTSKQFPVGIQTLPNTYDLRVFNLDAVADIELSFGSGLPKTEAMARLFVEDRIRKVGQQDFNQQLITAYQPLMMAMRFGINRIPVIIVDERVAIYGVTDIAFAIEKYKKWLKATGVTHE